MCQKLWELVKGDELDLKGTVKILLMDWQREKILYFLLNQQKMKVKIYLPII